MLFWSIDWFQNAKILKCVKHLIDKFVLDTYYILQSDLLFLNACSATFKVGVKDLSLVFYISCIYSDTWCSYAAAFLHAVCDPKGWAFYMTQ